MLAVVSPAMIPVIAAIPAAEFLPTSRSFGLTLAQLGFTGVRLLPRALVAGLAGAAPAHTDQPLARAIAEDQRLFQSNMRLETAFVEATAAIRAGRCDHSDLLSSLLAAVSRLEIKDVGIQRRAGELMAAIEARQSFVVKRYRRESVADADLKQIFKQFDPGALAWPL
jgi:hypothetical protein